MRYCALIPAICVPGAPAVADFLRGSDWPSYNRDLAGTRFSPLRQITALEREVAQLRRDKTRNAAAGARQAETEGADAPPLRFQARGLRSLRTRLGLGAEDFGRLIGVSGQSIYNWEAEKTTPRRA